MASSPPKHRPRSFTDKFRLPALAPLKYTPIWAVVTWVLIELRHWEDGGLADTILERMIAGIILGAMISPIMWLRTTTALFGWEKLWGVALWFGWVALLLIPFVAVLG